MNDALEFASTVLHYSSNMLLISFFVHIPMFTPLLYQWMCLACLLATFGRSHTETTYLAW